MDDSDHNLVQHDEAQADAAYEILPVATLNAANRVGAQSVAEQCGVVRVELPPADAIPRITSGAESRAGAHPWQATLRVKGRDASYHWCGAVVVSRFHLLTAAHCLREFPLATYIVRVGDYAIGTYITSSVNPPMHE